MKRLLILALSALAGTGASAQSPMLSPTPDQPRGPFYPRSLPAESDADLATFQGRSARGEAIVVSGRVTDRAGNPIAGARVEIWQTNAAGRYHHEDDDSPAPLDPGFQGWGAVQTGEDGTYRFRTVLPKAYSGRTPHIHFAVSAPGRRALVTQLYFEGASENRRDFILRHLPESERRQLLVRLTQGGGGAERSARFDIVLP